jgi:hypothetical protein
MKERRRSKAEPEIPTLTYASKVRRKIRNVRGQDRRGGRAFRVRQGLLGRWAREGRQDHRDLRAER